MVEGHVKIITMHILMDMENMIFYSLDELNHVLIEKINAENKRPFDGLSYSRYDLFNKEEKEQANVTILMSATRSPHIT